MPDLAKVLWPLTTLEPRPKPPPKPQPKPRRRGIDSLVTRALTAAGFRKEP
jgi:hypothetical protein